MRVQDALDWLEGFAPFATAAGFDNVGLIVGDPGAEISRVLFAVDATEEVVREAGRIGAELIIAHHPLMFGGAKRIRYDEPEGRVLAELASKRTNLIAAHTNFDQAVGGTSDSLAQTLGLNDIGAEGSYLRFGELPQALSPQALLERTRERLNANVRMYGACDRPVARVAVGAGALGEDVSLAARVGAQAFVVGEIHHHELIDACARGLTVYEAGHYATEYPGVKALYERFLSERPQTPASLMRCAPYQGATLAP